MCNTNHVYVWTPTLSTFDVFHFFELYYIVPDSGFNQRGLWGGGVGGKLLPQTLKLPHEKISQMQFKIMA